MLNYNEKTEKRREELLEKFEKGYIGATAIETTRQLRDTLKKEIDRNLKNGESKVLTEYNLVIKDNLLDDKLKIIIYHIDRDENDRVKLIFECRSIEMIFRETFVKIATNTLNNTKNKTEKGYRDQFDKENSSMYSTNVKLKEVIIL